MRARRIAVLATGLAMVAGGLLSGCGSGDGDQGMAPKISPEMQKKQDEMLQNYGKQNAELGRAKRQGKK